MFVRKLRQKLEKASPQWRYIHTHFGIGYRFAAEPIGAAKANSESAAAAREDLPAGTRTDGLGLGERDVRDQRELDGAQQQDQLAASNR